MLARSDIKEKITVFINTYFLENSETNKTVEDDTSFLDEGIIDSTGVLELVSFLEETFNIRIEDEEIIPDNFDSIKKLVNFIESKRPSI